MKERLCVAVIAVVGMLGFGCSGDVVNGVEGGSCESSGDCNDMRCVDGQCVKYVEDGGSCESSDECVSGSKCVDKVCKADSGNDKPTDPTNPDDPNKRGNAEQGEVCEKTLDCSEGLACDQGHCAVLVKEGDPCTADFVKCQNSVCIDGRCTTNEEMAKDTDGDGISDYYDRCDEDTDGDTIPNCQDLDSDGDTIPDSVEAGNGGNLAAEPIDSNYDGIPDFLDLDSDGNGIPDMYEGCPMEGFVYAGDDTPKKDKNNPEHQCKEPVDTDGDGIPDYISHDNDGDGAPDVMEIAGLQILTGNAYVPGRKCGQEACAPGTAANPWDTDGDTIPDYMSKDSDGDTLPDALEGEYDSDGDTIMDRYSLDSDGDTIPDSEEGLMTYDRPNGEGLVYCYREKDCDFDGVMDSDEPVCNGVSGITNPDSDGDGFPDGAEIVAGIYALTHGLLNGGTIDDVGAIACNPDLKPEDVFEYYFELPYGGDQKTAPLTFVPKVSKLDVVFNVDTTGSMSGTINSVKSNVNTIIGAIRKAVVDSGFALTNFRDFYVGGSPNYGSSGDLPFSLLGPVSTDADTVKSYTEKSAFTADGGADGPESGAESLYQIATGEGVSWSHGSIAKRDNAAGTWGGVDFRNGSLPVVIHVSDATSHDYYDKNIDENSYNNKYVYNPHYSDVLIPKLQSTGIRVISLDVGSGDSKNQMTRWSTMSNAVVPACAFKTSEGKWRCGENTCCLGNSSVAASKVNGQENACVLVYKGSQGSVSDYITQGVTALVKYGTYEVATKVIRDPSETKVDTSCFIKQVEAIQYIAPPAEPEASCNPTAVPTAVDGASYNNGFKNFAPGTASNDVKGAQLEFVVKAQNDNCVEPTDKAQVFEATIDVVNPTTGLSFGARKVSIIVPAGSSKPNVN